MNRYIFFFILSPVAVLAQTLVITNGPVDTTVCNESITNISCGFVNESTSFAPSWRIIRRSDDGSVISNMTVSAADITSNTNDGLEWVPDTTSGVNMSPNSRLVVGPVDETYNQSSYQCIFTVGITNIESSVGTLTVAGQPSLINDLTVRDGKTCNIIVSWTPSSGDPMCGEISNYMTISPLSDEVMIMNITDTYYDITGLTPNTLYNVTATGSNMVGAVEYTEAHVTNFSNSVPSVANIDNASAICVTYFDISWDPPNSTTCGNVSYEVSVSQPTTKSNNVTTSNAFHAIEGLRNSLRNVTITVTASNIAGSGDGETVSVQLPESQSAPPINGLTIYSTDARPIVTNTTSACIDTPDNLSSRYEIFLYWTRPIISDPCTTLPISDYFFHVTITYMNESEKIINASIIDSSSSSGAFNVSFTETFDEEVMPDTKYCFNVTTDNREREDDDDGIGIIIIIIIVILGILLLYSIIVVLLFIYLIWEIEIYIVSTIIVVVLAILTCGVGHYIGQRLRHYIRQRLRHRHGSVQQETEMREKSSDLYDAPVKSAPNQGKDQELYSYARTGPVNVIIPGSANS